MANMASGRTRSRLQRKREKDSIKQASKYLFLIFVVLFLMIKFGLPALIKMAGFISNISSAGKKIETEEVLLPRAPRLFPLPEATPSGSLNIEGYAESGITVQLFLRGISAEETTADNEGNFMFKNVHLRDGENEIYVMANDDRGNSSDASRSFTVTVDKDAPLLIIDEPEDKQKFFDNDSPITIRGKSEEDAELRINERLIMVDSDGDFEIKFSLEEGDNQIEAIAIDDAGNETKKTLTVNYSP